MPPFKSFNLPTINTRQHQVHSINSLLMEGFSSNLTQMFTPTGQCAEPILPMYQLCQGHWWGYESHSAIVLVVLYHCLQHPVYCVNVVGTQNAHNLISVSTDGKMCSWSLDMLSQPQVGRTQYEGQI